MRGVLSGLSGADPEFLKREGGLIIKHLYTKSVTCTNLNAYTCSLLILITLKRGGGGGGGYSPNSPPPPPPLDPPLVIDVYSQPPS